MQMDPSKKIDIAAKRNLFCLGCAMLCLTGCVAPDKTDAVSAGEKAYGYSLSLICDAAAENDLDVLTLLLDAKDNTEERIAGETPLMLAAKNGHVDAVKLLLNRGAKINARNPDTPDSKKGMTALMLAAQQGHDEVVRVLLEHGADTTVETRFGRTALDLASRAKKEETVRLLKDYSPGSAKAECPVLYENAYFSITASAADFSVNASDAEFGVYGIAMFLPGSSEYSPAIIYVDYYAEDNDICSSIPKFIENMSSSPIKVKGNEVFAAHPSTAGRYPAQELESTQIRFVPPNSPAATQIFIREKHVLVADSKNKGFYVLRLFSGQDGYEKNLTAFAQILAGFVRLK